MMGVDRRSISEEQLLVLWTWLLEGYVPVPHTVADLDELDELEAAASNKVDERRGRELLSVVGLRSKMAA